MMTYPLTAIFTTTLLSCALEQRKVKQILSNSIMVFLGKRSYGLYVFHLFGLKLSEIIIDKHRWLEGKSGIYFLLALSITVGLAVASYQLLERPFLLLKRKFEQIPSRPI
jgi:peptidoglycan/LPS O-acetylase OafA/YrhL